MAISKSFFGLRRKSTKSLTFSVLNGKQITKDRVSAVRNPKSEAQAMQRMKFALLSVNLAAYRPILERSVESVNYGNQSVQYIMAKNMKNWKLQGYRKDSGFQPAEMQLSYGTLPGTQWTPSPDSEGFRLYSDAIQDIEAPVTVAKIRAAISAEIGDQLTCVCAFSTGDPSNPYRAAWDSFYFTEELDSQVLTDEENAIRPEWTRGGNVIYMAKITSGLEVGAADGNPDILVAFAAILSRDGDSRHLRSNASFICADALGTSNARAIVSGRNSFMGISDLVTDWPVEATPVEHIIYTLGGKAETLGEGESAVTYNVAILLKQTINGNQVTTKEIAISSDGERDGVCYVAGSAFPLQEFADGPADWETISLNGGVLPDEFVSYDVARALVG